MMTVLETERLRLRRPSTDDAAFFLDLLNQPSWLEFIGDHEVYTLADAAEYVLDGPQAMYAQYGFSLSVVELKATLQPIGLCGLVRRETLPEPDLGFAFLPQFWGQAYALEAAGAVLAHGRATLGIQRILALCKPHNQRSIHLLTRLGFEFTQLMRLSGESPAVQLFQHVP